MEYLSLSFVNRSPVQQWRHIFLCLSFAIDVPLESFVAFVSVASCHSSCGLASLVLSLNA